MSIFTVMLLIILGVIAIALVLAIFGSCKVSGRVDQDDVSLSGLVIAVDFDSTLAVTKYPEILMPIDTTIDVIKDAKRRGATIILWTCREGNDLESAVNWCKEQEVPIDYVNENTPERIKAWGNDCRKISADVYIDDKAINSFILRPTPMNKGVRK